MIDSIVTVFYAFFVGFIMAFFGGGGSVLIIPFLIWKYQIDASLSTTYSLLLVFLTSIFASLLKQNKIQNYRNLLEFMAVSIPTIFVVRRLLGDLGTINLYFFQLEKDYLVLIVILLVLLFNGLRMLFSFPIVQLDKMSGSKRILRPLVIFLLGILIGISGIGAGFIIVPVLIRMYGISIHQSIPASLLIMSFNSGFGFLGDYSSWQKIDLSLVAMIAIPMSFGIYLSGFARGKIGANLLTRLYGIMLLVIAGSIILIEL